MSREDTLPPHIAEMLEGTGITIDPTEGSQLLSFDTAYTAIKPQIIAEATTFFVLPKEQLIKRALGGDLQAYLALKRVYNLDLVKQLRPTEPIPAKARRQRKRNKKGQFA